MPFSRGERNWDSGGCEGFGAGQKEVRGIYFIWGITPPVVGDHGQGANRWWGTLGGVGWGGRFFFCLYLKGLYSV